LEDIPIAFYCDDTAIGEGDLLAAALRDDGTREEALKAFRTRLLERIREAHPQLAYEMELENE
jgi:hypothetical protein